jgi:chromate reductase
VVSVSPGAIGGFGANHHLRQVLVAVGAAAMPHPEAYVGGASDLFDGEGALVNDKTKDFLTQFMGDFQTWINRLTTASA